MSVVLPAVHDVLRAASPIVGVPEEAEAAALVLLKMQRDLESSEQQVRHAAGCLMSQSSSAVSQVHPVATDRLVRATAQLTDDFSAAATAFRSYARTIERIHTEARTTEREVAAGLWCVGRAADALERSARVLRVDARVCVPSTWEQQPSLWPPLGDGELTALTLAAAAERVEALGAWGAHARLWAHAIERIHACRQRWNDAIRDRVEAERELVAQLRQTVFGPLVSVSGAADRAAITRCATGGAVHPSRWATGQRFEEVLSGRLTPAQVAEAWAQMALTEADIVALPLESVLALARADGVPFWVQDLASRRALDATLQRPDEMWHLMGLDTELSRAAFTEQIEALHQAVGVAEGKATSLPGDPKVQLIGFGAHDGALTAAISLGNADTAGAVGVNVLGMGSGLTGFTEALGGAEQLFLATDRFRTESRPAVITWVGYRAPAAPPALEVAEDERASAGAAPLARFIDGVHAARDSKDPPLGDLVVLGHSYGSTTAAAALKMTETSVDAFITYGSAGVDPGTRIEQLHADRVYATRAAGDQVARVGLGLSGRTDPGDLAGVTTFSAERSTEGIKVTAHDLFTERADPSAWNWNGKVGYLTAGTTAVTSMGHILGGGTP